MSTTSPVRFCVPAFEAVTFEPGADIGVRELELSRLAAELTRAQPRGTFIDIQPDAFTQLTQSGFAMYLQVTGLNDVNALLDFVDGTKPASTQHEHLRDLLVDGT